jgi:hypothetical protein
MFVRQKSCIYMILFLLGFVLEINPSVYAAPLTIQSATQFRSYRTENPIHYGTGDLLILSVNVYPVTTIDGPTVVSAQNQDTGLYASLGYIGGVNPNEFGVALLYDPAITGSWLVTATNGPDTANRTIPALGDVEAIPLVYSVRLTGSGITPTLSWTVPSESTADYTLISIIDYNTRLRLFWSPAVDIETTEYQIPDGLLQESGSYVFRVIICKNSNGNLVSRSECFFGPFTPLKEVGPDSVVLPTVGNDPIPTDIYGADFKFDCEVQVGEGIFLDPPVSIGYDYKIGASDTSKFLTVKLPQIGDNLFDLYTLGRSGFYLARKDLIAGETYYFRPQGVEAFRVLGIEEEAGLSPNDTTAFITELTFTDSGRFTGTMTPLIGYPARVDFRPHILNRKSKSKYVTCYIELPLGMDVNSIDVSTITLSLNGSEIMAEPYPVKIGDYDSDTVPDLMVKFNRKAIQNAATMGECEVTVGGKLIGYEMGFQGMGTIRFKELPQKHRGIFKSAERPRIGGVKPYCN